MPAVARVRFWCRPGVTWTGRTLNIKAVELVLMFKVPCTFCSAFKRLANFQAVVQSQTCLLRCKDGASTRGKTQAYPSANMGGQKGVPLRPSLSSHLRCIDSRILARLTVWTGHKEVYICLTQAYVVGGQGKEEDNPAFIFMTWLDSVLGGMRYQRCNRRRKRKTENFGPSTLPDSWRRCKVLRRRRGHLNINRPSASEIVLGGPSQPT